MLKMLKKLFVVIFTVHVAMLALALVSLFMTTLLIAYR